MGKEKKEMLKQANRRLSSTRSKIYSRSKNFVDLSSVFFPYFIVASNYFMAVGEKEKKNKSSLFFLFCSVLYAFSYTVVLVVRFKEKV